jgi:O-antigen/teichoic acid export membrane protein
MPGNTPRLTQLKRFGTASFAMVAGNAAYSATQWAVIAVLSHRIGMEAVGAFGFALSIVAPLIIFGQMQLRAQVAADASNIRSPRADVALRFLASAAAAATAIAAAATLALSGAIESALAVVICGLSITRAVESLSDLSFGYRQHDGQFSRIAASLFARSAFSLIFVVAAVTYIGTAASSAWAMAAAAIVAFLLADAGKLRQAWSGGRANPEPVFAGIRRQASAALPLGVAALLTSLHFSLPRLILQPLTDMTSVGRLTALLYFFTAMTILTVSIIEASGPRLARLLHGSDLSQFLREAVALACGGLAAAGAFALLLAYAGGPLLVLVYGSAALFSRLETALLSLCVALSIQVTFVQFYLILVGRAGVQMWGAALGSVVTALTAFLLIPASSVAGALASYACGLAASLSLQFFKLCAELRIPATRLSSAFGSTRI